MQNKQRRIKMKLESSLWVIIISILLIFAVTLVKEDILLKINNFLKNIPKIIRIFLCILIMILEIFLVVFEILQITKL